MANIFWVEDQIHWINRFQPILENTDFDGMPTRVETYKYAETACQKIAQMSDSDEPDLAILDANMNGNDHAGFTVSRALLKKWPQLPIIYLSEHSGTGIEQQAFEQADIKDFIAKHQHNVESVLCWRIRAVLRQKQLVVKSGAAEQHQSEQIKNGDLLIDLATWEVYWKGVKLMNPSNSRRPLAPTPRKILRYLVEVSPRGLTTGQMIDKLEADEDKFSYASYRQHITTLRKSFDQAEGGQGDFIKNCKQGFGIVTFGDDGAYCWKPYESKPGRQHETG